MSTTTDYLNLYKPEMADPADITKMNPNWDAIDDKAEAIDDECKRLDGRITDNSQAIEQVVNDLIEHQYNYDNPHQVTAEQLGIDLSDLEAHLVNYNNPHKVTKEQLGIDLSGFEYHLRDYNNPHKVTQQDIGLDKVLNVATYMETYTALYQIGLTEGSETIESIVENLPSGSQLIICPDTLNRSGIYPLPTSNGGVYAPTLQVIKTVYDYTLFVYTGNDGDGIRTFMGSYLTEFSGWQEIANKSELAKYLPLTGGTLTGDLIINGGGFTIKNRGIVSENDFVRTEINGLENPTADGHHFLEIKHSGQKGFAMIRMNIEDSNGFRDQKDILQLMTHNNSTNHDRWFDIFHSGNKPSGFYNGTSFDKTVNTYGIGNVLIVWNDEYKGIFTPAGGFTFGNNTGVDGAYSSDEVKYENGILTINSYWWQAGTNPHKLAGINKEGKTYHYQCL